MKKRLRVLLIFGTTLLLTSQLMGSDPDAPPITANQFTEAPEIDGVLDDMWKPLAWHSLNYVWMEWGTEYDSTDFYGRFKVGWSEETDLLYFFIEVTDDKIVEEYGNLGGNTFYNDIIEIFIDEDNSGGEHIFDNGSTNGENAFSYHLTPLAEPEEGNPETDFFVSDIAGSGWSNQISVNYITHFEDAILVKEGDRYFWEFALIVYTDDYDPSGGTGTKAALELNKVMGLALAYCESDKSSGNGREMFFGSYPGDGSSLSSADGGALYGYNDAWKDATDYNVLTLKEEIEPTARFTQVVSNPTFCYADKSAGTLRICLDNHIEGEVGLEIYDLLGKRVLQRNYSKGSGMFDRSIETSGFNHGVYILRLISGQREYVHKVML